MTREWYTVRRTTLRMYLKVYLEVFLSPHPCQCLGSDVSSLVTPTSLRTRHPEGSWGWNVLDAIDPTGLSTRGRKWPRLSFQYVSNQSSLVLPIRLFSFLLRPSLSLSQQPGILLNSRTPSWFKITWMSEFYLIGRLSFSRLRLLLLLCCCCYCLTKTDFHWGILKQVTLSSSFASPLLRNPTTVISVGVLSLN